MSQRNTLVRTLHDVGLAAWFGGSLMGAVGLNGATAEAKEPSERLRLSAKGWGMWAPVNIAAIGAHLVGGVGLVVGNKTRLATQGEGRTNSAVKTGLTLAAAGLTAYSGYLGRQVHEHRDSDTEGTTEPSRSAPPELAQAQQRLRWCQWGIPVLTGVLVVLGAQQGEQQRPIAGLADRVASAVPGKRKR